MAFDGDNLLSIRAVVSLLRFHLIKIRSNPTPIIYHFAKISSLHDMCH